MKKNILLTGKPGIGKTTAIKQILDKLDSTKVAGFCSREIREGGRRVGFMLETLSGEIGTLAHVDFDTKYRVSRYGVNVKDIDTIVVPELERARESGKIIIIDEIAKMELFSDSFTREVRRCLDTRRVLGTIQERRHPFLDGIRSRNDVYLLGLTLMNRDQIPMRVLDLLNI